MTWLPSVSALEYHIILLLGFGLLTQSNDVILLRCCFYIFINLLYPKASENCFCTFQMLSFRLLKPGF
ncbi:hypothetical protein V5799_029059 [Amblyomma americanum]|uniref:Uncharacterized protein n=1 Tax=Amblyomma americanum TaxID=6943 RepID=A0AAQ4ESA8_AMBAM